MWDRLMAWLTNRRPAAPDPAKAHVARRLTVIEGRLSMVEEWQRAEDAVRGSGRAAARRQ